MYDIFKPENIEDDSVLSNNNISGMLSESIQVYTKEEILNMPLFFSMILRMLVANPIPHKTLVKA